MAECRLTPAALRDLESIWKYTTERWGVAQAALYIDKLDACFDVLAQSPTMAPTCDHIRPGYRRQLVEHHAVYYRIEDAMVVVGLSQSRVGMSGVVFGFTVGFGLPRGGQCAVASCW